MVLVLNKNITDTFNEIMEAKKHSYLFRGKFRKKERRKKGQNADTKLNS